MEKGDALPTLRQRTLLRGKVIFNNRSSIIDCMIRELSAEHAVLRMPSTLIVPRWFDLQVIERAQIFACEVEARTTSELKVKLLAATKHKQPVT